MEATEAENCYRRYLERIRGGEVEEFKNAFDRNTHPLAIRHPNGMTLLHAAAEHGALEIVLFLLDKGAKINEMSDWGDTPLHRAVLYGWVGVVEALLRRFADPRIENSQHKNPLYYAYNFNNERMMLQLWRQGARFDDERSPLNREDQSLKMLQFLLSLGVDANRANGSGYTAYEYALYQKWPADRCCLLMKYTHPLPLPARFRRWAHPAAVLEMNRLHTRILILGLLGKNSVFSFCHDILRSIAEFA
jgi:ankyrin repeat protein